MTIKGERGIEFKPSSIETIDTAMHKFIEQMNLHAQTNKGFVPVPIIWVGAERTYQVKNDLTLRDSEGLLKLPLLTLERKEITKDPSKSPLPANVPDIGDGGAIAVRRRINPEKTTAFKAAQNTKKSGVNADVGNASDQYPYTRKFPAQIAPMFDTRPISFREKVVYQTTYIPMPVYINVKYELHIRTEYQQQMNQLVTPFISALSRKGRNSKYFTITHDNHLFEAFVDPSFSNDNNAAKLEEEERIFNSVVSIDVLGYLIGGDKNENSNISKTYENIVNVNISRERVVLGDEFDRKNSSGTDPFYKE